MTLSSVVHTLPVARLRRLVGASAGLTQSPWRQTRDRLFDLELDAEVADIRRRLETESLRKHRHDLVNAFTAVEGAALIMSRENLSATDRSTLSEILGSGLERLRGLLSRGATLDHIALAELTSPLTANPEWKERIHVDVAPDLVVAGSPGEIAEAVCLVLAHAGRRCQSGPLTVDARRARDRVEIRVHGCGPHLPARQRKAILEPELRPFRTGAVDGLRIAVRLVRETGGDVRIEVRPGGDESFVMSWPAYVG